MEKYITDNGYGASKSDAKQGFSDEFMKEPDMYDEWDKEHKDRMAYEDTGFGRDTGGAR